MDSLVRLVLILMQLTHSVKYICSSWAAFDTDRRLGGSILEAVDLKDHDQEVDYRFQVTTYPVHDM